VADGIAIVGPGVVQVTADGRRETVYVAGPPTDRWVFWNGRVFRLDVSTRESARRRGDRGGTRQTVTAPMPAKVVAINVKQGDAVKKGDTVVLLEAMKMELPVRASGDGVVAAVRCAPGDLVQADAPLVEFA